MPGGAVTTPLDERIARYGRIVAAREQGLSLAEIGRQEGIRKQRVAEILRDGPPRSQSGGRPRQS